MLGDGLTRDYAPAFSADGKHLFFVSDRDYNLAFSSFEFNYVYRRSARIYVAALDPEAPALFPPKSDEEEGEPEEEDESDGEDPEDQEDQPLRVEPEGWLLRTVALPGLSAGSYRDLFATDGALFYLAREDEQPASLQRYDLEEREAKTVLEEVSGYELSADGKKLLYRTGESWGIADAKAEQKAGAGKLDLAGLEVKLDPRAEWRQIFDDAWRIARDWFYDAEMHGKNWERLGKRYDNIRKHEIRICPDITTR